MEYAWKLKQLDTIQAVHNCRPIIDAMDKSVGPIVRFKSDCAAFLLWRERQSKKARAVRFESDYRPYAHDLKHDGTRQIKKSYFIDQSITITN